MVKFLFYSKAAKIPDNLSKHYLFKVNNKNTRRRCKNIFKVNYKDTRTTSIWRRRHRKLLLLKTSKFCLKLVALESSSILLVSHFNLKTYYSRKFLENKRHSKLRQLVIKKNFNSTEINGETRCMNELETWHIENDSQSDITEV